MNIILVSILSSFFIFNGLLKGMEALDNSMTAKQENADEGGRAFKERLVISIGQRNRHYLKKKMIFENLSKEGFGLDQ